MKQRMSVKRFWLQFIAFVAFAGVVPFLTINYYYDLFKERSSTAVSGWGMVSILVVGSVIVYILEMLLKALNAGFAKQFIMGITRVILPLTILLFIVNILGNNVDRIQRMLYVFIPTAFIAIIVNPFPVWLEQKIVLKQTQALTEAVKQAGLTPALVESVKQVKVKPVKVKENTL